MEQEKINLFMEMLKKEIGEPGKKKIVKPKSPLALYIETNIEGITQALKEKYTIPQLTKFINKKMNKQYSNIMVANTIKRIIQLPDTAKAQTNGAGYFFTYTVDGTETAAWIQGTQASVDKHIQQIKTTMHDALVILTSQKPMTKEEWKKQEKSEEML